MMPSEFRTNRHFVIIPINPKLLSNDPSMTANHCELRIDFSGKTGDQVDMAEADYRAFNVDVFILG